ncbi:hypothetical protein SBA4_920015 [Candidatus Sulfopaludibacter sp. SbA4]|nr:hypothetical protein SBA4_920015 [Candidatus Sulfopaludibacter sp. SbA4]
MVCGVRGALVERQVADQSGIVGVEELVIAPRVQAPRRPADSAETVRPSQRCVLGSIWRLLSADFPTFYPDPRLPLDALS